MVALLFLAITLIGYYPVLNGWFIADDFRWLEISDLASVLRSFAGPWGHGAAYRPLPRVSYLLDFWAFGYAFRGWIMSNFVLHAIASTSLYYLAARILGARAEAFCLAVLFCLSPLAHENVAWISGRTHIMCGLFVILSVLWLIRYLHNDGLRFLGLSLGMFLLALLSYEAAVYELLFIGPTLFWARTRCAVDRARTTKLFAAFGAVLAVYLALRHVSLRGAAVPFYPDRGILWSTLRLHATTAYTIIATWSGLGLPLAVAFVLGMVARARRTLKSAALALVLLLIGLMPFLSLPGLSYRFFYIAQLGLLLFLGSTIAALVAVRGGGQRWVGVALLVFTVLTGIHHVREFAGDWVASGAVTRSTTSQIKQLYPEQPAGVNFYVFGAPVTYSSVPMFISYFDSAVRFTYDHYRSFDGVVLNSWELNSKLHLVSSLRGQVVHARAACPSRDVLLAPGFEELSLKEMQRITLNCPAKYFVFDKATFRVREVARSQ
jgi:hypothetical protein